MLHRPHLPHRPGSNLSLLWLLAWQGLSLHSARKQPISRRDRQLKLITRQYGVCSKLAFDRWVSHRPRFVADASKTQYRYVQGRCQARRQGSGSALHCDLLQCSRACCRTRPGNQRGLRVVRLVELLLVHLRGMGDTIGQREAYRFYSQFGRVDGGVGAALHAMHDVAGRCGSRGRLDGHCQTPA